MRAFVTDKTVSINPLSETVVRMVLDTIASTQNGTLSIFTVTELEDLSGSLDLLTSSTGMRTDADIESSVLAVRNAVADNRGIVNFLTSCARPGQTSTGPGDIGNFFPFTKGISWTYTVQETEDGIAAVPFTNTVTVNGTRVINGIATTLSRESNPDGDGKSEYNYDRKTSSGVFDWSPVKDGTRNSPYRSVRFPAAPGSSFKQSLGDMGLSKDLDRDGIIERFNFTSTTTVIGLETVNVPAGTLQNSLKMRTLIVGSATVSSTRKRVALTVTAVDWYTRNLGLTKQTLSSRLTYNGNVWRDTHVEKLTETNGFPFTGDFPFDRTVTLDVDSNDILYDPVSGKLFASIRSSAARYTDHVVMIDPVSALVVAAIPVGVNPGPLAVSDDGQFLYVGLNGTQGSIRQVSIANRTAGAEWSLDGVPDTLNGEPILNPQYARDIAVQPGNPEVLAITVSSHPFELGYNAWQAVILDNGVERPSSATIGIDAINFSEDPGIAYGHHPVVDYIFAITPDGITKSEQRSRRFVATAYGFCIGKFYMDTGAVINAADGTNLGNIALLNDYPYWIDADATSARVAFASQESGGHRVEVFNADSFAKIDDMFIPVDWDNWHSRFALAGPGIYAIQLVDSSEYPFKRRILLTKKGAAD
jgi:hypothetical protein